MRIQITNALVLESRFGQSRSGNPYCVFRFLDNDTLNVYDLMQFGDSASVAAGLSRGATVSLEFELEPARDGGLRANLIGVGSI